MRANRPRLDSHGLFAATLMFALILAGVSCKPKQPDLVPEPEPPATTTATTPENPDDGSDSGDVELRNAGWEQDDIDSADQLRDPLPSLSDLQRNLQTVYFSFDKYDLSDETRAQIRRNVEWLRQNDFSVVVEGHCDERGTIEYNLSLGERRAKAVRDYMAQLRVDPARMRIITYGEERPNDPSHTESAWSRNRRAEFILER